MAFSVLNARNPIRHISRRHLCAPPLGWRTQANRLGYIICRATILRDNIFCLLQSEVMPTTTNSSIAWDGDVASGANESVEGGPHLKSTDSASSRPSIESRFKEILTLMKCCKAAEESTEKALTWIMKVITDDYPEDKSLEKVTVEKLIEQDWSGMYSDPEEKAKASEGKTEKDKMLRYLNSKVKGSFVKDVFDCIEDFLFVHREYTRVDTRGQGYVDPEVFTEAIEAEDKKETVCKNRNTGKECLRGPAYLTTLTF